MNDQRWHDLTRDDSLELTPDEILEGWHFCIDMDGLLANSKDPAEDCYCHLNQQFFDDEARWFWPRIKLCWVSRPKLKWLRHQGHVKVSLSLMWQALKYGKVPF